MGSSTEQPKASRKRASRIVSMRAGVKHRQEVYFYPLLMRKAELSRDLSRRIRGLLARKRLALFDAQVMALYREELAGCGLLAGAEFFGVIGLFVAVPAVAAARVVWLHYRAWATKHEEMAEFEAMFGIGHPHQPPAAECGPEAEAKTAPEQAQQPGQAEERADGDT